MLEQSSEGRKNSFPNIITRTFAGRQPETDEAISRVSPDAQAGLRQFPLERMMGYGVDYADAIELRARVLKGEDWQSTATSLAETCLTLAESLDRDTIRAPTQEIYFRRASALLRMSQALMLSDSKERCAIFSRAGKLYATAAEMTDECEPIVIDTNDKPLKGWLYHAQGEAVASVVIIGGIEGWAMDFDTQGQAFAARGIDALMLDGPGQGETRFCHGHYLSPNWRDAYTSVIDFLEARALRRPIGFVGNSMGGSIAMAITNEDTRIKACCNNGGPFAPWLAPHGTTFFSKMMAFCGVDTAEEAVKIWELVTPAEKGSNAEYPLLMVQGGEDLLVTNPIAQMLFDNPPTQNREMVIFSDGDHCIYRHRMDRDILISDWMRQQLTAKN